MGDEDKVKKSNVVVFAANLSCNERSGIKTRNGVMKMQQEEKEHKRKKEANKDRQADRNEFYKSEKEGKLKRKMMI